MQSLVGKVSNPTPRQRRPAMAVLERPSAISTSTERPVRRARPAHPPWRQRRCSAPRPLERATQVMEKSSEVPAIDDFVVEMILI